MYSLNTSSRQKSQLFSLSFIRIVTLTAIAVGVLFFLLISDDRWTVSGKPAVDMLIGAAVLNLVLYVLIRTSGKSWVNKQVPLLGVLVLAQIGLVTSLKMDGVYGNGRPKFVWRWQSSPADDFYDRISSIRERELQRGFSTDARSEEWTGFRGRMRDGVSNISLSAGSIPEMIWSRPVGSGWSSFAVSGDVCVTQEQRGEMESTVCYLIRTAQEIWSTDHRARFSEVTSGDGPRATPEIDGPYVYSFGATGILSCLELSNGKLVWSVDVFEETGGKNRTFGMAGSPLIVDDKVIVAPGGQGASLVAFDKTTGALIWSVGDYMASYSSPQELDLGETKTVLIFNGDGLTSHRADTGEQVFHVPWVSNSDEQNNVCQPICFQTDQGATRIFISSGYGRGSALFEFDGTTGKLDLVWKSKRLKSKFASAVKLGDYVYGLDYGVLTCISLATGERMWKQGRYGHGQLIRLGSDLIIQAENGQIAFVKASPTAYDEWFLAEALGSRTWNHPAIAGNLLLLRNDRMACCFKLPILPSMNK